MQILKDRSCLRAERQRGERKGGREGGEGGDITREKEKERRHRDRYVVKRRGREVRERGGRQRNREN